MKPVIYHGTPQTPNAAFCLIVENISAHRGLLLTLYILDRISGEHRPLVPGLFERATELHFKTLGE